MVLIPGVSHRRSSVSLTLSVPLSGKERIPFLADKFGIDELGGLGSAQSFLSLARSHAENTCSL